MWKLAPVRAAAAPNEYVIAQDVSLPSGKVVKKFFKGDLSQLRVLKECIDRGDNALPAWNGSFFDGNNALPAWNRSFHWYEVIDEHRPARIFVDIETKYGQYERVRAGVDLFISLLNNVLGSTFEWMVADASDASKISFHVIGGPLLTNLYHVGAVIRRLSLYAHSDKATCADLFDDIGEFIIDEAIYTRGRQFRVFGASKLGSTRVLRSPHAWWQALVNVPGECRDQLEIDGSTPVSTSMPAEKLFIQTVSGWKRREMNSIEEMSIYGFPSCLNAVMRSLRQLDTNISMCDIVFNKHYRSWRVPSSSTCCRIAGRSHKSNHVWYTVDIMSQMVHQRCMDEDCAGQSVNMPVEGWDVRIDEPCPFKGSISGEMSRHIVPKSLRDNQMYQSTFCVEPQYTIEKDMKSKMFRPNMRIWKENPNIIFPCEINIFFKIDRVLCKLGILEAWDDSELRVKDMVKQAPLSFYTVWGMAFTGQKIPHNLYFNDAQTELLQFIS